MAISDIVAKIAGAQFERQFYQNNIWAALLDDKSAEFPGYGNTLEIPIPSAVPTPTDISSDYTVDATESNAKFTTPTIATASKVDLILNKAYDLNILVNTLAERRTRPSLVASEAEKAARAFREELNEDLRDTFDAVAATASLAIATASGNFGNAAHQTAVDDALREARVVADSRHWDRGLGRVCVVGPRYHDLITEELVDKNPHFVTRTSMDDALIEGELFRYRGWTILMDDSLGIGTGGTDDAFHSIYFTTRGDGIAFGQDLRGVKTVDSEIYRGQLVQGVVAWGSVVKQTTKLLRAATTIT